MFTLVRDASIAPGRSGACLAGRLSVVLDWRDKRWDGCDIPARPA